MPFLVLLLVFPVLAAGLLLLDVEILFVVAAIAPIRRIEPLLLDFE